MTSTSDTLSRELLRWLQGLDLAYSIKNAKRDFSNGYLVAEIFCRYYPQAVLMHSFDNGTSLKVKKDNWDLLLKFFRKGQLEIPVDQRLIDEIMHCESGAAVRFLNIIYTFLTKREVKPVASRPEVEDCPPYAKQTATGQMREMNRSSEMQEQADELTRSLRLKEKMNEHEANLQKERAMDPGRYVPRTTSKILRGESRRVGADDSNISEITVQVKMRPIEDNVAQMRASKDQNHSTSRLPSRSNVALDPDNAVEQARIELEQAQGKYEEAVKRRDQHYAEMKGESKAD